jgi:hypothetical protein
VIKRVHDRINRDALRFDRLEHADATKLPVLAVEGAMIISKPQCNQRAGLLDCLQGIGEGALRFGFELLFDLVPNVVRDMRSHQE